MTKNKYQRGLCVFHGCTNVGTITPNATQRFCQYHMDLFQQEKERHDRIMREIHERTEQKRATREVSSHE